MLINLSKALTYLLHSFIHTVCNLFICLDWTVLVMSWTFTYSKDTMTWTKAKAWCENQSQMLMFILNEEENNFLKDNVPKGSSYYWIGLRKNESSWFWHGTGKMLEGTEYWAPKEPNNKMQDEDCVEIYINDGHRNGKWNDEKCWKLKRALCYNGKEMHVNAWNAPISLQITRIDLKHLNIYLYTYLGFSPSSVSVVITLVSFWMLPDPPDTVSINMHDVKTSHNGLVVWNLLQLHETVLRTGCCVVLK